MQDSYGKLLYSYQTHQEYLDYNKASDKSFQMVKGGIAITLAFIYVVFTLGYYVFDSTTTVELLFVILLTILLTIIYLLLKIAYITNNWLALFENGFSPSYLPLKYARTNKRFINYSEVERISLEQDEKLEYKNNKHCWRFKFHLKDGIVIDVFRSSLDAFDTEDNIEREYTILKYIMEHRDEKDHFNAEMWES